MMQQMRMSIYDFSDVAYDAFLLNGQTNSNPWTAPVSVGDIVRLRFINAGGSTLFNVKIPNTKMKMVHIQGNDVAPYVIDSFKIAPGETNDVLVTIDKNEPYPLYAESIDTKGAAIGGLLTSANQVIDLKKITPFPEPLPLTREMMATMMGPHSQHMHHHQHEMPIEPTQLGDKLEKYKASNATTFGTKYQSLKAAVPTNDPHKPISKVLNMELFGYMDRYIWFINGLPEHKAHPIVLEPNKRYRFVFTNPSMMHHPMHFHGHWFILRNGNGRFDPLLHTLDIPPGATVTADVDTDASGQWLFHCHLLYHMMSGMGRVFQYSTLLSLIKMESKPQHAIKKTDYVNRPIIKVDQEPILPSLVHHPMPHAMHYSFANHLELGEDPFHNIQKFTYKGLYGLDYNRIELFANDMEVNQGQIENADLDVFYWHLVSQFWALKAGANYYYRPAHTPYWQPGIGLEGLFPYFIETNLRGYYHDSSFKVDLELARDTQLTNNFLLKTAIRAIAASKTIADAGIGNGLNQLRILIHPYYRLMPGISVFAEYEHEENYGAFRRIEHSASQDTLTFGLDLLF